MNNTKTLAANERQKKIIISFLYLGAMFIMLLGTFFSAYSVLNSIEFQVLNSSVPGIVFGLLVTYLGLRYFIMVSDFKMEFYRSKEEFSWSNFKMKKRWFMKQKNKMKQGR